MHRVTRNHNVLQSQQIVYIVAEKTSLALKLVLLRLPSQSYMYTMKHRLHFI